MKKIFVFVAAIMMTAFVSCGNKTANNEATDSTAVDSIEVVDSLDSVVVDSFAADTACVD